MNECHTRGTVPPIEAMLRQRGSATLTEITQHFPDVNRNDIIRTLENVCTPPLPTCEELSVLMVLQMMLDGLLYEKESRYYPL